MPITMTKGNEKKKKTFFGATLSIYLECFPFSLAWRCRGGLSMCWSYIVTQKNWGTRSATNFFRCLWMQKAFWEGNRAIQCQHLWMWQWWVGWCTQPDSCSSGDRHICTSSWLVEGLAQRIFRSSLPFCTTSEDAIHTVIQATDVPYSCVMHKPWHGNPPCACQNLTLTVFTQTPFHYSLNTWMYCI